jgi:hypothetical protein
MAFGDSVSSGDDPNRMRDVLDRETIEKIEELHAVVVRAEAEQRFGLLRGKRTRQVAEAEAAEQAFLNEHGFATYNDFRLRIRRSTVADPNEGRAQWEDAYRFDTGAEAYGGAQSLSSPLAGSDDEHDTADREYDGAHDPRPAATHEGSDEMAPTPDSTMSQPSPTVPAFAPDAVTPPIPSFTPEPPGGIPTFTPEQAGVPAWAPDAPGQPVPSFTPDAAGASLGPPPVPTFVPRADDDSMSAATADFRRLTEPLFATLQAETDRYVASRIEAAEKQAAEIVARAQREGAEILAKATRMHDAVRSLLDDVTRQAEAFMGHTEELTSQIGHARQGVSGDLQALRELAERGQAAPPASPSAAESPTWGSPQRVAPPPVSTVGTHSD